MPDKIETPTKKSISPDWLVRGVLTKVGEIFDTLTGRSWKPASSLATSELVEKLKKLLDAEARETDGEGKFVPHNIKLKMQWDKFSTDAEAALKNLEHELLIAAVDHINDCRYHTFAPMKLEIMPDYFTEGVKLSAGFDNLAENESAAAVNVSVPDLKNVVIAPVAEVESAPAKEIYIAEFIAEGKTKRIEMAFADGQRSSVGRTKENDLSIDDASVSKIHAAFVLGSERQLMVADTGSTNGTFINGQRIAYGKAIPLNDGDKLKFGTVEVALEHIVQAIAETFEVSDNAPEDESFEANTLSETNSLVQETNLIAAPNSPDENLPSDLKNEAKQSNNEAEQIPPTAPRIILDFEEKK